MRVCYVEMVGGAAGDMLLAAFLDAGCDRAALERALRGIVADGWTLTPERVTRRGIAATYAGLHVPGEDGDPGHRHDHGHDGEGEHAHGTRRLADVLAILARSALTARQKERAAAVYRRLAEAEARVHGTSAEAIHFHEVGQIDAILDVAAFCVALDLLAIDEVRCSAFPLGNGEIAMAHGRYPNPPPATAELLRGWPTRSVAIAGELVTTTAAAILTTLCTPGDRPDMTIAAIGYGAGRSDFPIPNVTRITIGPSVIPSLSSVIPSLSSVIPSLSRDSSQSAADDETISVLEANIDDMSPEHFELALERVFAAGARDAWLTPIAMKKGRPAVTLSAIAAPDDEAAVAQAILRETTTIGVRVRSERRYAAEREIVRVDTPYGPVRIKRTRLDGLVREKPEYEDLVRIAREHELPLAEIVRTVEQSLAERIPS